MPQMAPLNWLMLFLIFSAILITFLVMNYYSSTINPPVDSFNKKMLKQPNWKW
uniref:ATP synthase complex subunit 8 n=1 Tax=Trachys troglodytiformis TaxID=1244535 RepID=A0A343C3X5_9COLE|nr:ATP synthase F0 subunit 8 [Trachys troglodytiformis]